MIPISEDILSFRKVLQCCNIREGMTVFSVICSVIVTVKAKSLTSFCVYLEIKSALMRSVWRPVDKWWNIMVEFSCCPLGYFRSHGGQSQSMVLDVF